MFICVISGRRIEASIVLTSLKQKYPAFAVFLKDMRPLLLFTLFALITATAVAQSIPKLKMAELVKRMNQQNDTTYVVNFWATFCKPCVEEIPGFLKVTEKYKSQKVKLILVSLDLPSYYPKRIADYVTKNKWKASIAWLNETNADIFCPMIDSGWSGAIPATIIVNAKSGYKKFWEGDMSEAGFEKELKEAVEFAKKKVFAPKFISPMNAVVELKYYDKNSAETYRRPFEFVSFKSNDSTVFSVREGVVSAVVNVEDIKVVIVKNRELYYTYSNLKTVQVKKGETVTADQIIGFAAKDFDEVLPTVDFYLSNEKGAILLTKNNFLPRDKKSSEHRFSPMLGIEPE